MEVYYEYIKYYKLQAKRFCWIARCFRQNVTAFEDYGSGLNYNRKKWNELLDEVMEQKIKTIIITHKDRFIRFGYDWFEKFCMKFNTSIVVVNNEELSPQEELVQDIVSILHMFSCRLYGLRKYKKQIERDEEIAKELQDGNKSNTRAESQDTQDDRNL